MKKAFQLLFVVAFLISANQLLAGRMYNPQLGIWVQVDPADEFHSPYTYVGNNPINNIDPDGCETVYNNEGVDVTNTDWGGELYPDDGMVYNWDQTNNSLMALNIPEDPNTLYVGTFFDNLLSMHGDIALSISQLKLYNLIKTTGDWDFKNKTGHIFSSNNSGYDFMYYNEKWRYDDFGNYHFGHVAHLNKWPKSLSLLGAGAVQIKNNTSSWRYWKSSFDDPRDADMIKRGYNHEK